MEWLLGVGRSFGATEARILNVDGGVGTVQLSELHRRGLPALKPAVRLRRKVNLRTLRPTDVRPELQRLGFNPQALEPDQHQAFEAEVDGQAVVLPALLLMRELFAPAKFFLPAVFQAQALDSLTWLAPTEAGFRMVIDANWYRTAVLTNNLRDCAPVFAWLRSCRTAEAMVSSIHRNSLRGAVALDPPEATVDAKLAGVLLGRRLLVTELRLMNLAADETPSLVVEGFSPIVLFAARALSGRRLGEKVAPRTDIPAHPDGTYEISDNEWEELGPTLASKFPGRVVLDQRRILDGVLRKLATGLPWRSMTYSVGNWENAAFAYYHLKRRGRLEGFLSQLRDLRSKHFRSS
jgi:hypothetical protein